MNQIKRRDLLKGLVSAGVLGSTSSITPIAKAASGRNVLVIGAGLSGLYSAMMLEQFGYSVQVVEGRNRVGGRLYTLDEVPGHPEAGGNTIGPNYGRILDVAQRLNVSLRHPAGALPSSYVVDGTRLSADEWKVWKGNPLPEAMRHLTPNRISGTFLSDNPFVANSDWRNPAFSDHDVSAAKFFQSKGLNEKAIALINVNNSYGNTLEEMSLLSLYRVMKTFTRAVSMKQPSLEVAAGNMRLPEAMAQSLSNPVGLGQKIDAVEQSAGLLRAVSEAGETFDADAVVIALPVPAVRNIRFTPEFSSEQIAAFESIEYHKVTQAHFVASKSLWESEGQTAGYWTNGPLGRIFTRPIVGADGDTGQFNMTAWINGNECDQFDGLPEDLASEKIMEEFRKLYPDAKSNIELKKLVRWKNEPLNQGVWPVWKPGQIGKYANLLHQPNGRIFFAGEHTSYSNSGMEGAAESGERAALEVMRSLS